MLRKLPPPLPIPARVEVWEYLEDGMWSSMGEAFVPAPQDPFWAILMRITDWWPFSDNRLSPEEVEDFDIRPWESTEWQGAGKSHATLVPQG